MIMDINIPKWVSVQTWKTKNNSVIAYAFNHKTNLFFEFEGLSAILWRYILDENHSKILDFVKENCLEKEIEVFFEELASNGLLSFNKENAAKDCQEHSGNSDASSFINDFMLGARWDFFAKNGYLLNLFLELTYDCNLKCIHCLNDKHCNEYIKFEDIKPVIDEARALGVFFMTLSGGECTLNKDFVKIAEYIRETKSALQIFTNGQVLYDNNDLFDKLISLYPFQIALSLYGMKPEIHEKITGVKGSYHKTMSIIKRLKEKNINVRVNSFFTRYNASEYEALHDFCENNGLNFNAGFNLMYNPDKSNRHLRIESSQLEKLYRMDEKLLAKKRIKPADYEKFKDEGICRTGYVGLRINPKSEIFICSAIKTVLGNIKDTSLESILKLKNLKFNKIRELKHSDLKDCNKYDYCRYCTYCIGIAQDDGYYLKPYSLFCEEAKIRMKVAESCGVCSDLHK